MQASWKKAENETADKWDEFKANTKEKVAKVKADLKD